MVYVHFAEGTEEIEFVTIVDILRRSSMDAASVSITGKKNVTGSHGMELVTDLTFEEADYDECEMIVLPGGMPGTLHFMEHEGLMEKIREFHAEGKKVAAICAAPMVLAQAGILEGKRAVIYPGMEKELKGAVPSEERVLRDGNILTSKGPGTAMEFALEIVRMLGGQETAEEVRKRLVMADV